MEEKYGIRTKKLMLELKSTGQLPAEFKGIKASEITIAANLHSKGVEAVDVVDNGVSTHPPPYGDHAVDVGLGQGREG